MEIQRNINCHNKRWPAHMCIGKGGAADTWFLVTPCFSCGPIWGYIHPILQPGTSGISCWGKELNTTSPPPACVSRPWCTACQTSSPNLSSPLLPCLEPEEWSWGIQRPEEEESRWERRREGFCIGWVALRDGGLLRYPLGETWTEEEAAEGEDPEVWFPPLWPY